MYSFSMDRKGVMICMCTCSGMLTNIRAYFRISEDNKWDEKIHKYSNVAGQSSGTFFVFLFLRDLAAAGIHGGFCTETGRHGNPFRRNYE